VGIWQISPRTVTTALVGLVVLDVALVGMALKSTRPTGSEARPLSAGTSSGSTEPSATTSGSPQSSASSSATGAKAPLQTMLVALDDKRAWRIVAGSCSKGGAALATTTDGGKTWTKGTTTLRRIVRLRPEDARTAFVIGATSGCAAELRDTTDGGDTWTSAGTAELAWFRDPRNPKVVQAPGPVNLQPCGKRAVLDLTVLAAESARLLCADGLVRSTANNGQSWTNEGKVDGAVALAVLMAKPAETYVARLDAPDCAGVQILRVKQQVATSCVKATIPAVPGQIAMSLIDGGGWLAVDDITLRSTDDLVTWSAS